MYPNGVNAMIIIIAAKSAANTSSISCFLFFIAYPPSCKSLTMRSLHIRKQLVYKQRANTIPMMEITLPTMVRIGYFFFCQK